MHVVYFQIKNFEDYVLLYVRGEAGENAIKFKTSAKELGMFSCSPDPRWEIAVASSDKGFQQMSFVNSIATTKVFISFLKSGIKFLNKGSWTRKFCKEMGPIGIGNDHQHYPFHISYNNLSS